MAEFFTPAGQKIDFGLIADKKLNKILGNFAFLFRSIIFPRFFIASARRSPISISGKLGGIFLKVLNFLRILFPFLRIFGTILTETL